MNLSLYAESLQAYCNWLASQSEAKARLWSRALTSPQVAQVEGAVAEAVAWDYLAVVTDRAWSLDKPGVGGCDFAFEVGGKRFAVEVTNASSASVTDDTGLSELPLGGFGSYAMMTERLWSKVRGKGEQLRGLEMPRVVFVTTLHFQASAMCMGRQAIEDVMLSPSVIAFSVDPPDGAGNLHQETDLQHSIFLKRSPVLLPDGPAPIETHHGWLSAFLLGGFGPAPQDVRVYGGVHPEALHPFALECLPYVPMASLRKWRGGHFELDWSISQESEDKARIDAARRRLVAAGFAGLVRTAE